MNSNPAANGKTRFNRAVSRRPAWKERVGRGAGLARAAACLTLLGVGCAERIPVEAGKQILALKSTADSAEFRSNLQSVQSSGPPAGSTNQLAIYKGESITLTFVSSECAGVPDVMEVRGPVAAVLGNNACVDPWPPQTLGPSPSDGILDFVLTDPRFGRGPYAVTGTYPDYTVYVEDGFMDFDYNDNILACHFTPPNCPPSGDTVHTAGGEPSARSRIQELYVG